jgi:hypothetical protein
MYIREQKSNNNSISAVVPAGSGKMVRPPPMAGQVLDRLRQYSKKQFNDIHTPMSNLSYEDARSVNVLPMLENIRAGTKNVPSNTHRKKRLDAKLRSNYEGSLASPEEFVASFTKPREAVSSPKETQPAIEPVAAKFVLNQTSASQKPGSISARALISKHGGLASSKYATYSGFRMENSMATKTNNKTFDNNKTYAVIISRRLAPTHDTEKVGYGTVEVIRKGQESKSFPTLKIITDNRILLAEPIFKDFSCSMEDSSSIKFETNNPTGANPRWHLFFRVSKNALGFKAMIDQVVKVAGPRPVHFDDCLAESHKISDDEPLISFSDPEENNARPIVELQSQDFNHLLHFTPVALSGGDPKPASLERSVSINIADQSKHAVKQALIRYSAEHLMALKCKAANIEFILPGSKLVLKPGPSKPTRARFQASSTLETVNPGALNPPVKSANFVVNNPQRADAVVEVGFAAGTKDCRCPVSSNIASSAAVSSAANQVQRFEIPSQPKSSRASTSLVGNLAFPSSHTLRPGLASSKYANHTENSSIKGILKISSDNSLPHQRKCSRLYVSIDEIDEASATTPSEAAKSSKTILDRDISKEENRDVNFERLGMTGADFMPGSYPEAYPGSDLSPEKPANCLATPNTETATLTILASRSPVRYRRDSLSSHVSKDSQLTIGPASRPILEKNYGHLPQSDKISLGRNARSSCLSVSSCDSFATAVDILSGDEARKQEIEATNLARMSDFSHNSPEIAQDGNITAATSKKPWNKSAKHDLGGLSASIYATGGGQNKTSSSKIPFRSPEKILGELPLHSQTLYSSSGKSGLTPTAATFSPSRQKYPPVVQSFPPSHGDFMSHNYEYESYAASLTSITQTPPQVGTVIIRDIRTGIPVEVTGILKMPSTAALSQGDIPGRYSPQFEEFNQVQTCNSSASRSMMALLQSSSEIDNEKTPTTSFFSSVPIQNQHPGSSVSYASPRDQARDYVQLPETTTSSGGPPLLPH